MINWCLHSGDDLGGTNFAKSDNTSTQWTSLTSSERTVFLSLVGLGLHHSYPEQEAYLTKDHQRLQEPEQGSTVLKKKKINCTVLKLNLASQEL